MFNKKKKDTDFFLVFLSEIKKIFGDISYVYRNFIHWNISKVIISLWSIILGIICMIPFLILTTIVAIIDPIPWLEIFANQNPSQDILISGLSTHPFWLILMTLISCVAIAFFLLASSYGTFLLTKLSLKYLHRKKLDYKKNEYFSKKFILTYIALISWNFIYLLAPIMIWGGGVFFLYLLYNTAVLSFTGLSYSLVVCTIILIFALSYVAYRILFGYVILAQEKKSSELGAARSYLAESIKLTKGNSFWKFLFIAIIYAIIMSPFNAIENYMTNENTNMRDTLAYKTKVIENIDAKDIEYYEYITKQYQGYSDSELVSKIVLFSRLKIVYFFVTYFLFGGLFIVIITSFHRRVLLRK